MLQNRQKSCLNKPRPQTFSIARTEHAKTHATYALHSISLGPSWRSRLHESKTETDSLHLAARILLTTIDLDVSNQASEQSSKVTKLKDTHDINLEGLERGRLSKPQLHLRGGIILNTISLTLNKKGPRQVPPPARFAMLPGLSNVVARSLSKRGGLLAAMCCHEPDPLDLTDPTAVTRNRQLLH